MTDDRAVQADRGRPPIPPARVRPFRNLTAGLSAGFLAEADELLFLVREHGISKVPAPQGDADRTRRFLEAVHEGWKHAQRRVAQLLTVCLQRQSAALARAKQCRIARDKPGAEVAMREEGRIGIEIAILRRMLDVVLWNLVRGEQSLLRRLYVRGGTHSLSPESIAAAMPTADDINARPLSMALCTDMLSLVHVGDLLVSDLETGQLIFIELKAGDKNFAISKAAEFAVDSGCQAFEQYARWVQHRRREALRACQAPEDSE